jgi:hypothetical protein
VRRAGDTSSRKNVSAPAASSVIFTGSWRMSKLPGELGFQTDGSLWEKLYQNTPSQSRKDA